MKTTKEASGWFKQTITLLLAAMICISSQAQKKEPIKFYSDSSKAIAFSKPGSDTLEIIKAGFLKIGDKNISVEVLKKSLIILSADDIQLILNTLQEYPARFANPFAEWLLKTLNLTLTPPKKTN